MEIEERLTHLENVRDWQGMVEELEKAISNASVPQAKAALHLRAGRLLDSKFKAAAKALKHFQDAYKLNPALVESLVAARTIYWELGKFNMVQRLLELEIKGRGNDASADLVVLLASLMCDVGEYEKAKTTLEAAGAHAGSEAVKALLADLSVGEMQWRGHVAALVADAEASEERVLRGALFLRAARIARRFDPSDSEGLFGKAYQANALANDIGAIYEGLLAEQGMLEALEALQLEILMGIGEPSERSHVAFILGSRWVARHQRVEVGASFLEQALNLDPSQEGAFGLLKEVLGRKAGDWDRLVTLAEEAAGRAQQPGNAMFLMAQAGVMAWREQGNLIRAKSSFERLAAVAPEHPQLKAFELQIGSAVRPAKVTARGTTPSTTNEGPMPAKGAPAKGAPSFTSEAGPGAARPGATPAANHELGVDGGGGTADAKRPSVTNEVPEASAAPLGEAPKGPPSVTNEVVVPHRSAGNVEPTLATESPVGERLRTPSSPEVTLSRKSVPDTDLGPSPREPSIPPPSGAMVASAAVGSGAGGTPSVPPASSNLGAGVNVADLSPEDLSARIASLRSLAAKQEASKRLNEYVKTSLQLAPLLDDEDEKVALLLKVADLYVTKFANQAEAIKVYEQVLNVRPDNHVAIEYLLQMYEKRRDWEKLLGLQRREALRLTSETERASRFLDMARLAHDRVKKPDVCIELWNEVLQSDASNLEALSALSVLYERAKDFDALASILEKQASLSTDRATRIQVFGKLGAIYGDRLGNEEAAVVAWRALLELDPSDRKAQEALKKKYLALGKWDELEQFYADSGKWDELIRVLEQQEAKETSQESKIQLLFKVAELWAVRRQKADRAAKSFERVLELDPNNLQAATALAPIYAASGNAKALAGALEVKLRHEEGTDRVPMLREVAELYEGRAKEPEKAFERHREAFALDPHAEGAVTALERTARAVTAWPSVVAVYREVIAKADGEGDSNLVAFIRLKLGRVCLEETSDVGEALGVYQQVYDADRDNLEAAEALEKLFRQTSKFQELLELLDAKRQRLGPGVEWRTLGYKIASLLELELNDVDKAVETYSGILADDPKDGTALAALDRIYRTLGRWDAYADTLRQRIDLTDNDDELVDLKLALANVLESRLSDRAGALLNYREVLLLDGRNDGARVALEEMLKTAEAQGEIAELLAGIYEESGDAEKLIGALGILAKTEEDVPRRVQINRKAARICADVHNQYERAFGFLAAALKDEPGLDETRQEVERIARSSGDSSSLIRLFSEVAEAASDGMLARSYWMRVAALHGAVGNVDGAAAAYRSVLEAHAGDAEATLALEELLSSHGRWSDLLEALRRRIEQATDGAEVEVLYERTAQILEEHLADADAAIGAYNKVLETNSANAKALVALERLFTRLRRWAELATNLEAQLALEQDAEQQVLLTLRLAALQERDLGQVEQAIEGYRIVLERDVENQQALSSLERLGADPRYELTIADLLEALYRQFGNFERLIGVHEVQVRHSEDLVRKVELLHQIAQLHEDGAGNINAAFDALLRALRIDPTHETTLRGLERTARTTDRFGEFAQALDELAAEANDPDLASALYSTSARFYEVELGSADKAIERYNAVLRVDPTNLAAAEALERVLRVTGRVGELSALLRVKADILSDVSSRKECLFEAARIDEVDREELGDAVSVYLAILEMDPEEVRAMDGLLRLYEATKQWNEFVSVALKKVDQSFGQGAKKEILFRVGAIHEGELQDAERAIETYNRILELDPDDLVALGHLDVLYESKERWNELLEVLGRESELSGDVEQAASFQFRTARIYEAQLQDVARAIDLYRDILTRLPYHEPTRRSLEALMDGEQEPLAASAVMESIYEASQEWRALVRVLDVQVRHSADPYSKVELLIRMASLHEDALDDATAAFETYARALQADSSNEVVQKSLERLANALGFWARLADILDEEASKLGDSPEKFVEMAMSAAHLRETHLEEFERAIRTYRRVLEVESENRAANSALARLLDQTEQWADLVPVLVREIDLAQSGDEIVELRFRLGRVQQVHLQDLDGALHSFRELLSAAPHHQPTVEVLEGLFEQSQKVHEVCELLEAIYRDANDWEKLRRVYEAQLGELQKKKGEIESSEIVSGYFRISELCEEKLIDGPAALNVLLRGVLEFPVEERFIDEVQRLAPTVDGGWELLANAYADVLGAFSEPEIQQSVGCRLARTFEEELADVNKAEETYRYVLSIVPDDLECLSNLDRIYVTMEAFPELAGVLERRVVIVEDNLELTELYTRLGEIYETRLGNLERAGLAYKRIFDNLDKSNEAAIAGLERVYTEQGQWNALKEVYERELEVAGGDAAEADVRAKLARLASDHLKDRELAIDTWNMVLDLRGEDSEALLALAEQYEHLERWAKLVEILERQADAASSDDDRVNVLTRRARVFSSHLNNDESALEDWNRVLDIDPSNLAALRAIVTLYRRQDDAGSLVFALQQLVDRAAAMLDSEELIELYREIAKTHRERLEQAVEAEEAWLKLLDVGPDEEAFRALEDGYRAEERWRDVIAVKMRRASSLDEGDERIAEYERVAALWSHEVGDADGAREALEKIMEIDPSHDGAYFELEKLHTAAGRWEPLVEVYLARLDTRVEQGHKSELLRRIARVFEEHLSDKNQALDALINAFAQDIFDRETAKYLERMAQATGRWAEVIENVNNMLQYETDLPRKVRLCLHLAKWYGDDLGRPDYAQPYYAQVVQIDPNNVGALRQMGQIYRKSANWQQLGATLARALEVAVTDTDRKEILTEQGEFFETHAAQPDNAISRYRMALEIDSNFLPAIEHLERIFVSQERDRELVDVLMLKAPALNHEGQLRGIPATEQVTDTLLRVGGIYETKLKEPGKAASAYREALAADATSVEALRGLARMYSDLQQWSELISVLERQLELVATERERTEILLQLASVQEEQFLKGEAAALCLEQVLEIDPNSDAAYRGLERSYRKLRRWDDVVRTYERHLEAAEDKRTKVEIWGSLAQVFAEEMADPDRAIDAYRNLIDLEDNNIQALEALGKLLERTGQVAESVDFMSRVAELTVDAKQRVEALFRVGKALDEKLGDRVLAQDKFEMALDVDPAHVPSLVALREIAMDNLDYDRAARFLDIEQSYTAAARPRARLLVELGRLQEEHLGDHDSAVLSWEAARESDPENEDAAYRLANHYFEVSRWEAAEPLLELLVRRAGKRERQEQHALNYKLGAVCAALGKDDKALKAFTAAAQLDITDKPTIRGLAETSFKLKDWGGALTNFQKVLTSLGDDNPEERTHVYFMLGCIKREQGQPKQAISNFEKALSVDSGHRPTLDALVELYTEGREWKQVVAFKRQILDGEAEGPKRFKMLLEIADTWQNQERNTLKALEALEEAREIEPNDFTVLNKLLGLYQSTENWVKVIDTIRVLADLDKDPIRRSKFTYTIAQIYRDKLNDADNAVEYFGQTLDLNPKYLEAFERINKILTLKKDAKGLERAYRKMIRRLSSANESDPDLEFNLWHQLGLIYRDRLNDPNSAIEAFKMATRFKPDEAVERQILAELYERTGQMEAAIGEHALVLQRDPMRVDPYRSLYRIYLKMQEYDRAWCMCSALAFLQRADDEEMRFFEQYRAKDKVAAKARLDLEQWTRNLFHKDEDICIGKLFAMITPAAMAAKTVAMRTARTLPVLDPRFKQDLSTSTVTFAKTFGWAAQVLGLQMMPDLYIRNDVPGALKAELTSPPASIAGNTVLTGFTPQELTFIVAKHLAFYRDEHYIRNLFTTLNELKVLFFAGLRVAIPTFAVPAEMEQHVADTAKALGMYMQPVHKDGLKIVVQKFLEEGSKADLRRWMHTVELTAVRAGFLLCGDLEVAKKMIVAEQQMPGDLSPSEKVKEILLFSVSEQYFGLRKALGITVV